MEPSFWPPRIIASIYTATSNCPDSACSDVTAIPALLSPNDHGGRGGEGGRGRRPGRRLAARQHRPTRDERNGFSPLAWHIRAPLSRAITHPLSRCYTVVYLISFLSRLSPLFPLAFPLSLSLPFFSSQEMFFLSRYIPRFS